MVGWDRAEVYLNPRIIAIVSSFEGHCGTLACVTQVMLETHVVRMRWCPVSFPAKPDTALLEADPRISQRS